MLYIYKRLKFYSHLDFLARRSGPNFGHVNTKCKIEYLRHRLITILANRALRISLLAADCRSANVPCNIQNVK